MSRNKNKFPYFRYIFKNKKKKWVKIFNKNLIIMPNDVDYFFNIYNGKEFIQIKILKEMIGYKFGEFINTKKRHIYKKNKKK